MVVALLFWWLYPGADSTDMPLEEGASMENTEGSEDTTTGSVNTGASVPSLSYANALIQYKDRRIQLDLSCQASPNNVTYKDGTSIMLDNRSPSTRTVKLGSTYSIKPWGFKIVKLDSATVPATWYMDCDGSQNVATVLIQK